jgi:pimeloyl-ACP methyl ester carboxylesterase
MIRVGVALLLVVVAASLAVAFTYSRWYERGKVTLATSSKIATTQLGPVEYFEQGVGPAVVILHGSPGGYDQFLTLGGVIAKQGYRVISISRPGYLRTPIASGRTPAEQAALVDSLLTAFSIEHTSVIGISGGGPSALAFAENYPDRIDGLVLVAAVSGALVPELEDEIPALSTFDDIRFLMGYLFPQRFVSALGDSESIEDVSAVSEAERLQMTSELFGSLGFSELRNEGYSNDYRQFFSTTLENRWDEIDTPVLLIYGELDETVPVSHAHRVQTRIQDAQLVMIPGASHPLFITHVNTMLGSIFRFLHEARR